MPWGTILSAIPSVLSFAGGLFGKKKSVSQEPQIPGFQLETGQALSNFLKQYLPQYQPGAPYTGNLTQAASPFETMGLNQLQQYLGQSPTGEVFGAGKQGLLDTLRGSYAEAGSSPLIQALMKLSNQSLADQITQSRGQAGARGNYFSTAAMDQERLLRERTQNSLQGTIGDLLNQERARQFGAIPYALQYDEYGNQTAPLKQIAASQTFGALPRLLDAANMERAYQEFGRQQTQLSALPQLASSFYGQQPNYGVNSVPYTQPNQALTGLGNLFGSLPPGIWDIFKPSGK